MTKNDFLYALKASGCLYHNGQTYYEENELIRTFEDMEMFEEEKSLKDMTDLEHAIRHIKTRADAWAVKEVTEALQSISERLDKALSQEPCDDAISRDAVIKDFTQWRSKLAYTVGEDYSGVSVLDKAIRVIKGMPSVTQKSGKWINDKDDMPTCSECGYIPQYDRAIDDYEYSNYCPRCGAKMESEEQTE